MEAFLSFFFACPTGLFFESWSPKSVASRAPVPWQLFSYLRCLLLIVGNFLKLYYSSEGIGLKICSRIVNSVSFWRLTDSSRETHELRLGPWAFHVRASHQSSNFGWFIAIWCVIFLTDCCFLRLIALFWRWGIPLREVLEGRCDFYSFGARTKSPQVD